MLFFWISQSLMSLVLDLCRHILHLSAFVGYCSLNLTLWLSELSVLTFLDQIYFLVCAYVLWISSFSPSFTLCVGSYIIFHVYCTVGLTEFNAAF